MYFKKFMLLLYCFMLILCSPSYPCFAHQDSGQKQVICSSDTIFLFQDRSLKGDVVAMMEYGDAGLISKEYSDCYYLKSGKYKGYASKSDFVTGKHANKIVDDLCVKQLTVRNDSIFFYDSPSLDGTVLGYFSKGERLSCVEEYKEWVAVDYEGFNVFINKKDVSISNLLTYAKEPDLTLFCELYPDNVVSYESDDEYDHCNISDTFQNTDEIPLGQQLCDYARNFVGNPYVWGGESLTDGCDCSGFVMLLYRKFGITLPHSSFDIRKYGLSICENSIDLSIMEPGDIICYEGHVSIYLGNGSVISAASEETGICIRDIHYRNDYVCVRRLFSSPEQRVIALSDFDKQVLYRMVEAEAGNQDFLGKMYVANVIINRMLDIRFPDTVLGVISASKQFSPYWDGRFNTVNVSQDTIDAVTYAVTHADNSNGALYFLNPETSNAKNVTWFEHNLTKLFTYKEHDFYK